VIILSKISVDELEPLSRKSNRTKIPPGQHRARKWPILHVESVPEFDGKNWPIKIGGLVENEITWSWEDFLQLPKNNIQTDLHCVTSWSLLNQNFAGVSFKTIIDIVKPKIESKYVTFEAKSGYTSALPLSEGYLLESDVLLAYEHEGKPLDPKHGGPLRSLVPQLYLWKSVKWLTKITFLEEWERGFWESRNYHIRGDPWLEERYSSQERPRRKDHMMK
jgi:DMSO/TMAO reductase YedYZ molybdopterin-dependent catalytic subunit